MLTAFLLAGSVALLLTAVVLAVVVFDAPR